MDIHRLEDPYIIGETAYNHEGDITYLYRMIDDIAELELHAVKFHMLLAPESYMQTHHPLLNELEKWTFNREEWDHIIDYAHEKGLDIVVLCDDVESIKYITNTHVAAAEIHATSINDWFLLKEAAHFHGPVILGTGGTSIDEVDYAVNLLKGWKPHDIILMYGFQSYPTDYREVNLSKMVKMKNLFGLPVGYADHTAFDDPYNEFISVAAAFMGFNILEKHYTPDYGKERIDYHAAVGKAQMNRIKTLMKIALKVHGHGGIHMSQPELEYGNTGPMKKAIVAKKDIKKGEKLSFDNLWFKRTEQQSYIQQRQFLQLIGLEAAEDIRADDLIDFTKVTYRFTQRDLREFTHTK